MTDAEKNQAHYKAQLRRLAAVVDGLSPAARSHFDRWRPAIALAGRASPKGRELEAVLAFAESVATVATTAAAVEVSPGHATKE